MISTPALAPPIPAIPGRFARARRPQFSTTVLPVADLPTATAFYCGVFDLDRLDACGRGDFALLGHESTRLSLYRIPGYLPPDGADPVLVCTLPPADFAMLIHRVRAYGGAIAREADLTDAVPHLLFTDPGGANLIEARGELSFALTEAVF